MGINNKYFTDLIDGDHPRDDLPDDIGFNGPDDDMGYVDDTSVTFIIDYDFTKLECNEHLLSYMVDSFFTEDDSLLYDVIESLVDDSEAPSDENREGIYNHLVGLVQHEYHKLRYATTGSHINALIANGYYVVSAEPVSRYGSGTILTLDELQ